MKYFKYCLVLCLYMMLLPACGAPQLEIPVRQVMEHIYLQEDGSNWTREFMMRKDASEEQQIRILKSFEKPGLSHEDLPPDAYPEAYGGSYINQDGDLVILLLEGNEPFVDELRKISGNPDLLFETAFYSYRDLLHLWGMLHSSQTIFYPIVMMELDVYDNCVRVFLEGLTPELEQDFRKNISNHAALVLEDC